MKTLIGWILCLLSSVTTSGQDVALQLMNQSVLIVGIPNPIRVVAEGYSFDSLIITTNNGIITLGDRGLEITPYTLSDSTYIYIKVNTNKGVKDLDRVQMSAKCMVVDRANLYGKETGHISAEMVHNSRAPAVPIYFEGLCGRYAVRSFRVIIFRNEEVLFMKTVSSPNYASFHDDDEVEKMIKSVKPGDFLTIDRIKAMGPGGKTCNFEIRPIELAITSKPFPEPPIPFSHDFFRDIVRATIISGGQKAKRKS